MTARRAGAGRSACRGSGFCWRSTGWGGCRPRSWPLTSGWRPRPSPAWWTGSRTPGWSSAVGRCRSDGLVRRGGHLRALSSRLV